MVFARQFLNTGTQKVFILLLFHSFCRKHVVNLLRRIVVFPSNAIHVTMLRSALQRFKTNVCNFCYGKCLFRSYMSWRVPYSRHHFAFQKQLFRKEDKVLVIKVFSDSKQLLSFYVNDQQCNVRMPYLWASYSEASASL